MIEDKLSRAERIRLESLSQAQHMTGFVSKEQPTEAEIIARAQRIEDWLKEANHTVS